MLSKSKTDSSNAGFNLLTNFTANQNAQIFEIYQQKLENKEAAAATKAEF